MKPFLLIILVRMRAVISENTVANVTAEDISANKNSDGEDILARSRRQTKTDVCRYKKGDWSPCDDKITVS